MTSGERSARIALPQTDTGKSSFLALIHAGWHLGCIGLIIYGIYVQKRYQEEAVGIGSVITKVLASADTRNRSDLPATTEYRRTWDETDIVQSVPGADALAIMTNSIITPEQRLGDCPEDIHIIEARCTPTTTCAKGSRLPTGNGIMTGRCVNANGGLCDDQDSGNCTCEVSGWCPVERISVSATPLFPDAEGFKVLMKAYVQFPEFGEERQNVFDDKTDADLLNGCTYDAELNPLCPVFTIGYILRQVNVKNFMQVAMKGALIRMTIKWDCDFDVGHDHECQSPQYTFERLNAFTVNRLLPFWNLRDIDKYHDANGMPRRDTKRITGIFILFAIDAKGGKFNFINYFLALGAAFSLFNPVAVALQRSVILLKTYHSSEADQTKSLEDWIEDWKKSVKSFASESWDCCRVVWFLVAIIGFLISVGLAIFLTVRAVKNDSALWDWMALVWDTVVLVSILSIFLLFSALLIPKTALDKTASISPIYRICIGAIIAVIAVITILAFLMVQVFLMYWFHMFGDLIVLAILGRMALMVLVDIIIGTGVLNLATFLVSFIKLVCKIICCDCCRGDQCRQFMENTNAVAQKVELKVLRGPIRRSPRNGQQ